MSRVKNGWRTRRAHVPPAPDQRNTPYPATKFFDNVSFIGTGWVGCFLIETSEGLMLLDCMEPGDAGYIEEGIRSLGYDPADLKKILITHGHADHYGDANIFREKYGTVLYMSQIDQAYAMDPETPRPAFRTPMPYRVDRYLEDGEVITLGDTQVTAYFTPGHTPGGMSFTLKVYDEGRCHHAALWGGTGLPAQREDREIHLASYMKFSDICLGLGVDVALTTHPFVDNGLRRLDLVREIVDGVPNPFVLGYEGYHRFEEMYHQMYVAGLQ